MWDKRSGSHSVQLCCEAMGASKGNLQCEVCHLDGITTKSSLKRHQRFYCKGGAKVVQQPLTTDVKVVKVSEQLSHHEIVLTTSESGDNARECQHCGFEFLRVFNQQRHACPLEPDLDLSIPVLTLLSGEEAEQFRADHRCNTADQVNLKTLRCFLNSCIFRWPEPALLPRLLSLECFLSSILGSLAEEKETI